MQAPSSRQTAYPYNGAASCRRLPAHARGWPAAIQRMIEQRYAFLPLQYDGRGYLFRGMRRGLRAALFDNRFWHFATDAGVGRLERELDVLFCSQDLSDALSVARLWEDSEDAVILVFHSALFNEALKQKRAAMMATAEPGLIFKYPLLTFPLTAQDMACFIVSAAFIRRLEKTAPAAESSALRSEIDRLAATGRLIVCDPAGSAPRRQLQETILAEFERRAVFPAKPCAASLKPGA